MWYLGLALHASGQGCLREETGHSEASHAKIWQEGSTHKGPATELHWGSAGGSKCLLMCLEVGNMVDRRLGGIHVAPQAQRSLITW